MKITLLAILLLSSVALSQPAHKKFYASGGFILNFMQSDELNTIVNQYNSNPAVVQKMDQFDMLFGPSINIGVNYEKEKSFLNIEFAFSLLFSGTKSSLFAQGTGRRTNQDVQITAPLVSGGIQYFLKAGSLMNLGAGFSMTFGSMNILTRSYDRFTPTPDYTRINQRDFFSYTAFNPTLFLNFIVNKRATISLRPGYTINLISQNLAGLNSFLNGTSIGNVNIGYFNGPNISLNLQIRIGSNY